MPAGRFKQTAWHLKRHKTGERQYARDIWVKGARFPCMRFDLTDQERMTMDQSQSTTLTRFTLRSTPSSEAIVPADRLEHEGERFSIRGIRRIRRRTLRLIEIYATAITDPEPV